MNEAREVIKIISEFGAWALIAAIVYFFFKIYPAMKKTEEEEKTKRSEGYNKNWDKLGDKFERLGEKLGNKFDDLAKRIADKLLIEQQLLVKLGEKEEMLDEIHERCMEHAFMIKDIKEKVVDVGEKVGRVSENVKESKHFIGARDK